jgi:two-component system chemotaxis response regulator CheY
MKILIVDDSKAMRMIVKRTLKDAGFGDHATSEAASGVDALAALRREAFDVILCDWNMPEMNGIEMLQVFMAEKLPGLFGFVTSEGSEATRAQAAAAGAVFLIAKPFTKEDFQAALTAKLAA